MGTMLKTASLTQLDYVPNGLIESSPENLHEILSGPTLIHLPGIIANPLFISVLLHGNEPTGFLAVQALLENYRNKSLPRSVSIFFGNIAAARLGMRRVDGQLDYNRIWPGTEHLESAEVLMMQQVVDEMSTRNAFASIDIHNNTGLNPHYACINVIDNRFLQLASLFGRLVVYFIRPKGVLSAAFANLCPSVTLECGKPGQKYGTAHAFQFLQSCLRLSDIPAHPVARRDVDLFHTVTQVTISKNISFGFHQNNVDYSLPEDLDRMNFTETPCGTYFGKLQNTSKIPVTAIDENGANVTEHYFSVSDNNLILNKAVMPSMLTQDVEIIRQDCLCYLMERISV